MINTRVAEIRAKLREQLQVEPGIMSFAYPYVGLWNKLDKHEASDAWFNLSGSQTGILYTHIPFCLNKCGYCDYATNYVGGKSDEEKHDMFKLYVDAIEEEITLLTPDIGDIGFGAVYLGGGTPTIFCERGLERMVKLITSKFSVSKSAEISIEVYPWEKMLHNKLELLKNIGVNRVSIGVQDFDDEVISFTGRRYSGEEASRIVRKAMGLFDTVNVDLICGLPKQTRWQQTLEETLNLGPQQITIQPFSNRHSGIRFHHQRYNNLLPDLNQMIGMYTLACQMLTEAGYAQTSRHQFVREGEHKYEQKISESFVRLGIGAHSISLLPGLTYKNFTSIIEYQDAMKKGELPVERGFRISADEEMRSYLFYSLSADCGRLSLNEKEFLERFGQRIQDEFTPEVQALEEEGLIKVDYEKIDLTPKGVYFTSVLQRTFYNLEFMKRKETIYSSGAHS